MIRQLAYFAVFFVLSTFSVSAVDLFTTPPGLNPGWPVVFFDVPAGSKVTVSSIRHSITSKIYFERRLKSASSSTPYQNFKKIPAGGGAVFAAEKKVYRYAVGGFYFGDFQTSYGPMSLLSTKWSNGNKKLVLVLARWGYKTKASTVTITISP